jgi:hypothetical protein
MSKDYSYSSYGYRAGGNSWSQQYSDNYDLIYNKKNMAKSVRYSLNKADLINILKVLGYALGSTAIAVLIDVVAKLDLPVQWVWIIPILNTLLVLGKKFFSGK